MSSLRLLISHSHDPWFNLAVEDAIFKQMAPQQRVLFLWRNDNTVVIGRAQNPWKECNTRKMAEDNVKLARRSSGGGAVFHDLGNSCFTFMAAKPEYNKAVSTQIIVDALKSLGLEVNVSGRNDLTIVTVDGDKKISGSAYRETPDRGFHHGTLLLSTNLNQLTHYLNPDPKKLQIKGITSVRSRVANLNQYLPTITHDLICQAISETFFDYYNERVEPEIISPDKLPDLPGFTEIYARQSDWNWNFGKAPMFSHSLDERFLWGNVEIHLDIEQGYIKRCRIFTDSLYPAPLEQLANDLSDCLYDSYSIQQKCLALKILFPEQHYELDELAQWLSENMK